MLERLKHLKGKEYQHQSEKQMAKRQKYLQLLNETKGEFLPNRMPSNQLEKDQECGVKMGKVGFAH